jgi:chromosome segregation ATPase
MAQKMTLDRLAAMTQNSFTALREELRGEIGALRTEMQEGFQAIRGGLEDIKGRLRAIESKVDAHDLKFEYIIQELEDIKREIAGNQIDTIDLEKRVTGLEKKVGLK